MSKAIAAAEHLPIEEVNRAVFDSLRAKTGQFAALNDHGFPAFRLETTDKDGRAVTLELVVSPHYLLCTYPFGYLRFGAETRVFLNRLDDYVSHHRPALLGLVQRRSTNDIAFMISAAFSQFLRTHADRNYGLNFGRWLVAPDQLEAQDVLLWPRSAEDRLFDLLAATLKSYGLPVTVDKIILNPAADVFIGFERVSPEGVAFRDGDDFVRFTPSHIELREDETTTRQPASQVLLGWALDKDGRVCALYRAGSGFSPPSRTKLLRFLDEAARQQEQETLNVLAELTGS
jgi:hypothetical protein